MKVILGEDGLKSTWQKEFPSETKCCKCDGVARIGFVAFEVNEKEYLCKLHNNEKDNMWPHDSVAVAVYFCKKCLNPIALFNQA